MIFDMYNEVLVWPTLIVTNDAPIETFGAASMAFFPEHRPLPADGVTDAFSFYVATLLGGCATHIKMMGTSAKCMG